MKIHITKTELLSIMSIHFGQNVTEVVIAESTDHLFQQIARALQLALGLSAEVTPDTVILPNQKILAIKTLRQAAYDLKLIPPSYIMGLAESKWAIENWNKWASFVAHNNRLPKINYRESPGLSIDLS